ncbi:MAG: hypothetical protein MK226_10020 [Saprospiraceae bacterium]|nr:hypothetical protein [Saprospiraceae bacterium]
MSKVFYYLIIKPLSHVPLPILYLLSDVVFLLLYRLVGYRTKVVRTNMRNSFPDKSEAEITVLMVAFYKHFCDLIVEGIRVFSMPKDEIIRRFKILNPELIDQFYEQGKGVAMIAGHYNNWEMAVVAFDLQVKHKTLGIYAPLKDTFMDEQVRKSRGKYGVELLSRKKVRSFFEKENLSDKAIIFANDQAPSNPKKSYWMDFLNQDTPVFFGPEKYTKEKDLIPVFAWIKKVKRGHYETTLEVISNDPKHTEHGFITESHTRMLEEEIRSAPEFWLWTHRRWKRKREEGREVQKTEQGIQ